MRCLPRCASGGSQAAAPRSGGFSHDTISLSKKSLRAAEQERADVARARRRWIREQGMLDSTRLVFIDETAANTKMVRLSGRCPRGERLVGRVPHGHWKTITSAALRAQVRELRYDCGGWGGRPCAPYPLVSQDRTFSLTHAAIDISFETSWPHESQHAELGRFSIGGSV